MSIPDPIVLLDARAKYAHPSIVCERTSPKSVWMPQGVRGLAPANALPWDHDPLTGASRGLLIEASRTNIVTHSGDLTQWSEVGSVAVSDSGIASTVRGKNWFRLESIDTGSAERRVRSAAFSVTEGEYYTHSVDVMPGEVTFIMVYIASSFREDLNSYGIRVVFNLQDGGVTVFQGGYLLGARAKQLRSGAWRLEVDVQAYETSSSPIFRVHLKDAADGGTFSQLNTGDGLYLCAPQVEPNEYGNAATSYIETAGSAAVRSGDDVHIPNIVDQPWFVENEGTYVVEAVGFATPGQSSFVYSPILTDWFGDIAGFGLTYRKSNSNVYLMVNGDNRSQSIGAVPVGERILAAYSYDLNKKEMWGSVGGGAVSSLELPDNIRDGTNRLRIGGGRIGGSSSGDRFHFNGHILRVVYYPAALSNADLQSLTAIQE